MEKNRKYIVLTILVAMVAVAGYLNRNYNDGLPVVSEETAAETAGEATMVSAKAEKPKQETKAAESDALKDAKTAKDTSRSRAMELLNSIINDENSGNENREKATAELAQMSKNMEAEGVIEGILKTKGFEKSVVFITNGIATVAVKSDKSLSASDVAKIQDVVKNNGNISGEKITITQVK